ncbi:MAG: hypothetical protein KGZ83_12370 [Sulfuricella sp.]|nr:hypothetical protein [Sulfuricella sp.]
MTGPSVTRLQQVSETLGFRGCRDSVSPSSLIRDIQERRGQEPCFASEKSFACAAVDCEWGGDCQEMMSVWIC